MTRPYSERLLASIGAVLLITICTFSGALAAIMVARFLGWVS